MSAPNKVSANMKLPTRVKDLSAKWASANGTDLSGLVETLLRDHLSKKGIDCDIPVEEFLAQIATQNRLKESGESDLQASFDKKKSGLDKIKAAVSKKK